MKKNKKEELSEDRKKYLKKIKLRKIEILVTQIFILVAFIALWEILARTEKIDSFIDMFSGGCNVGININSNKNRTLVDVYLKETNLKEIQTRSKLRLMGTEKLYGNEKDRNASFELGRKE